MLKVRQFEQVFVTVGTTKFDKLIKKICSKDTIQILKDIGCKKLIIQYGNGTDLYINEKNFDGIEIIKYSLKQNIINDIRSSDLIISHAGAGSCLEILRENKPVIVVVNEDLMDNHQIELADKLFEEGYLFRCTPTTLIETIKDSDFTKLRNFQKGNLSEFIRLLNLLVGLN